LAITTDQRFLCFRQTKYAIKRELLEETGYTAPDWTPLGSYVMDPNRYSGTRYLYLAQNATKVAEPDSDDLEDQQLLFLDRTEVEAGMKAGEFKILGWTAVVALALHHLNQ
jgi:ADP-ribose pyrophosphatase